MLRTEQIEELVTVVSTLGRKSLIELMRQYQATFPLDFTREFLADADIDRLRHIFVAICLQCQQMPTFALESAA